MTARRLTVMISSTVLDLPSHREQARDACERAGAFPLMMEHLAAEDTDAVAKSIELVDKADIYVAVLGYRYGTVPEGHDRSITEIEIDRAIERGIPRLVFLMDRTHDVRPDHVETGAGAVKLRQLKERLGSRVSGSFTSPMELKMLLVQSLGPYREKGLHANRAEGVAWQPHVGATVRGDATEFSVWFPTAETIDVVLFADGDDEITGTFPLERDAEKPDYFITSVDGVMAGSRYKYRLNGVRLVPDPASRYQPLGIHGPSEVVDPTSYTWTDQSWAGPDLDSLVIYQVHVGTATREGTFDSLNSRLGHIKSLGATALLLMPVADFSGRWNWGYDGTALFAPARVYGGPEGLRRLVNAAHERQLGVLLDVQFNHAGPDGNYLPDFGDGYFSDTHTTPWGPAFNFEGKKGRPVRDFFVDNACYWTHEYHVDGLRFDTIGAIQDNSELYIVEEIHTRVKATLPDRSFITIAEADSNDPNLVRPCAQGGRGLDAVYADDFHHQIMVALTNNRTGYYVDYSGTITDIIRTINDGWFYIGQHSKWRNREIGNRADDISAEHFIYCLDNHDQVGNRLGGDRLSRLVDEPTYRAVSALFLMLPFTPLMFMGQEWSATTPFLYFTDFSEELGLKVEEGRADLLASLFPDNDRSATLGPQDKESFTRSRLRWEESAAPGHAGTLALYKDLLRLRRHKRDLYTGERGTWTAQGIGDHALATRLTGPRPSKTLLLVVSLANGTRIDLNDIAVAAQPDDLSWRLLLDTEDPRFGGSGSLSSVADGPLDLHTARGLILESA